MIPRAAYHSPVRRWVFLERVSAAVLAAYPDEGRRLVAELERWCWTPPAANVRACSCCGRPEKQSRPVAGIEAREVDETIRQRFRGLDPRLDDARRIVVYPLPNSRRLPATTGSASLGARICERCLATWQALLDDHYERREPPDREMVVARIARALRASGHENLLHEVETRARSAKPAFVDADCSFCASPRRSLAMPAGIRICRNCMLQVVNEA